ncbi:hypothetical protein IC229_14475 [Spirosoma sp. BT702]|uniref:Uncharacterized protein n=1 Tax=Spirosoma profusum TaxID=2771354 RepID=A0A926Y0U5_9BACT|nr:hypothetical protein [Spirosoma profusum]MBD2701852.1 hypothetical protein [Spirosoma profusum]
MKQNIDKSIRNRLQADFGYNPDTNHIRIENHYKWPENRFKQHLTVADLVNVDFQNTVKEDLIRTYQSIVKTPTLLSSVNINKPSTSDLYLICAKEIAMAYGMNLEVLFKRRLQSSSNNSIFKSWFILNRKLVSALS